MIKGKVLLIGKEQNFLVDLTWKKVDTKYGAIDLTKIKKIGQQVKSNKDDIFVVVNPTYQDFVKKFSRGPQVVLPKDASAVVGITGISSGLRCLDAGGGSAFLSTFIGNLVKPNGKVYTYEKRMLFRNSRT